MWFSHWPLCSETEAYCLFLSGICLKALAAGDGGTAQQHCNSCRGPKFYSQHLHGGARPSVSPAPVILMPSSDLCLLGAHVHIYTCRIISDNPNPKPLNSLNSFCVTSDFEVLQGTLPDKLTNILLFYSFYLSGDTFIIPSNHLRVSQGIYLYILRSFNSPRNTW